MIKRNLIIILLLSGLKVFSQNDKHHFIGINLLQLPASTLNVNYSSEYKPFLTPIVDLGYTFNYDENIDVIGKALTAEKNIYDGYTIEKQSGGYIKLGTFLNIRKSFEKQNYFQLGAFVTGSMVNEKALYLWPFSSLPYEIGARSIEHSVYLAGLAFYAGYEFVLSNRTKSNIGYQLSTTGDSYLDLYGHLNFIPGMGYSRSMNGVFPMIIWNVKYTL